MFSNAVMLAGIGGAVLPLVLHYLGRSRSETIGWGAMMFLPGSDPAAADRYRSRQVVLLVLRMGTVALLAVAMARPVARAAPGLLSRPGAVAAVILLDRSASMGADEGGQTRLEVAKRAALGALARLDRGDEVALVLIGDDSSAPPQFTTDLQRVASQIVRLRPSSARGDVAEGLGASRRLLASRSAPNRLLMLACDLQASGWSGVTPGFLAEWAGAPVPIEFIAAAVGARPTENVAVTSVRLMNPPCIRGVPARFRITVRNFGDARRLAVPVTVSSAVEELDRATVDLPPNGTTEVLSDVRFTAAGSQVLGAAIASADLPHDNLLNVAVDVIEPIRVLVISGSSPRAEESTDAAPRGSMDFLRLAIAPDANAGGAGLDPATVKVVPVEPWPELNDGKHDVVVLADVPAIPARRVRQIERFIYTGGGVLVAPGPLSRVDSYNSTAWRDGSGFLPAPLESPVEGAAPTSLMSADASHPVFTQAGTPEDDAEAELPPAEVRRYFPVFNIPAGGREIASYRSSEPFAIDRPFGKGRVLLVTTPLDASWGELPASEFYLPFVQSAVRYLAAGDAPRRNGEPGRPLDARLPGVTSDRATLVLPDGNSTTLDVTGEPGAQEVRFTDTRAPGRYEIHYRTAAGERVVHYVVGADGAESDPAVLSGDEWRRLASALGFTPMTPEPARLAEVLRPAGGTTELWPWLLMGVVGLGLLELYFARRWSARGDA